MNWIELTPSKYTVRTKNKVSNCQLEVDVQWVFSIESVATLEKI